MRDVSVNVRSMKEEMQRGLSLLARARETIVADDAILSGTPCIRGTRIPADNIAEMLANGDETGAICYAWPAFTMEQVEAAALARMHGLHHAYAQSRYEALTGWMAPAAGGPRRRSLGPAKRRIDKAARMMIARELGHGRLEIVPVYIGS